MPTQSGRKSTDGPQLGAPVIIGAVVVLLLLCVWLYRINFKTVSGPPTPHADRALVQNLAIKCQGDFNKLSPQEQAKVNEMENGYGALAIRNIYSRSHR